MILLERPQFEYDALDRNPPKWDSWVLRDMDLKLPVNPRADIILLYERSDKTDFFESVEKNCFSMSKKKKKNAGKK
jgi:hypothetical protein